MEVRTITSHRHKHRRNGHRHRLNRSSLQQSTVRLPSFWRNYKVSLLCLTLAVGSVGFGYRYVRSLITTPQAVLVLGGATEREQFAAKFAQSHPDLPIWISSGAPRDYSEWVFSEAGVKLDRLRLDYRAVDTLTNFTTLADDLKAQGVTKVYLITSDYHMRRSQMIGEIILGSRGIELQPISIPSDQPSEDWAKALRDGGRALVWLATGYTGHTDPALNSKPASEDVSNRR
jgi:uncharacterized SAM-binding protein YcdF (DUF218 family)